MIHEGRLAPGTYSKKGGGVLPLQDPQILGPKAGTNSPLALGQSSPGYTKLKTEDGVWAVWLSLAEHWLKGNWCGSL
jgi:hypothetical protein